MATKIMLVCLYSLFFAVSALAQTVTTTDTAGNTVVEVVTTDPQLGLPTTQILETLEPGVVTPTPSLTSPTATPITPTATSATLATTATTATTQAPDGQQGPVGAPAPIDGPASTYIYTYTTTDAAGDFTAIVDTYTPTVPTTAPFTPTGTGTILNFSAYLSMIGTNTVAPDFSASSRITVSRSLLVGTGAIALGLAGGFGLVFA
ncbi:hypothetical protein BC629DRAFT_1544618 [Irpex lacteus]|nr:hypothetical protein BC629DRAFT_1544618 [Irpex lacteus]